jgi:hypothetical protein
MWTARGPCRRNGGLPPFYDRTAALRWRVENRQREPGWKIDFRRYPGWLRSKSIEVQTLCCGMQPMEVPRVQ